MYKIREIDFLVRKFADWFDCVALVETSCWNADMHKSESPQSYERRARQADTSKAHRKPRAFYYWKHMVQTDFVWSFGFV